MNNDNFFEMLLTNYPQLAEISITNNVLKYQNVILPLNSFMLQSLFGSYSDLYNDIRYFDANDFFQLIYIHIIYYQNMDDIKGNIMDIDEMGTSKIDANRMNFFTSVLYYLVKFQNYLRSELQYLLSEFKKVLYNLENKEKKNDNDLFFIKSLMDVITDASQFDKSIQEKKQNSLKLELKNDKQVAGYVNAFTVLLMTLFIGLILSLIIFVIVV